jgi:hypothetical protein
MKKFTFVLILASLIGAQAQAQQQLTTREADILERGPIDTGPYVAGGVLGTLLLPFGIGQAVQGRYSDTGWIFTVGEVGSVVLIFAGAGSTFYTYSATGGYTASYSSINALAIAGAIGLVGFRLAEIIDLWAGPPAHNRAYERAQQKQRAALSVPRRVSFAPMAISPMGEAAPGASFTLRF